MKSFVLLLLCLSSIFIQSQNNAIGSNEKLVFTASYNMSGLLTDLAQVTMETSEVKTSNSTLLHLKGKARTYTKWDGFFKINDLYESYVNINSLKPYLYKRDINEGGYYKFMQYNYNHKTNTVKSLKRKRRRDGTFWEENKSLNISSNTKDIIATLYHIRNLDIDKATIGSSDTFTVLMDNEEFKIIT